MNPFIVARQTIVAALLAWPGSAIAHSPVALHPFGIVPPERLLIASCVADASFAVRPGTSTT